MMVIGDQQAQIGSSVLFVEPFNSKSLPLQ